LGVRLGRLTAAYREKFGFPFLYAVKGRSKRDILGVLPARLAAAPDEEFDEALRQVYRIARFRLEGVVGRGARMNRFASGPKRNYYGKGDVVAYRLHRMGRGPGGSSPVFGATTKMLICGEAFWPTYTTGDNSLVIATDSMKNFIQRETLNFPGHDLESYCRFLAQKFLVRYRQVEGIQVSAERIPYADVDGQIVFQPSGPERATAQVEIDRQRIVEVTSGWKGFQLLRLGGSAFAGFVRDEYTTLPETHNRPLHMWLDLDWSYEAPGAGFTDGDVSTRARGIVRDVFASFESGSIQQVIHRMGTRLLRELPAISEVRLEAQNRTWDTVAEQGDEIGVYTDARSPYGCLGLTLRRGD
jgi:urate oxidase/2-oxo-4-hydroxy-4-carboxy-5-ureidoimidazoline decarboxylase